MAKSNVEHQRDYRARQRTKDVRLDTWVEPATDTYINALAAHAGKTRRQIIEDLAIAEVLRVTADMAEEEKDVFLFHHARITP